MIAPEIVVRRGIPERFRFEAAAVYVHAFRRKLERMAGTSHRVVIALGHQLDLDLAVAAYTEDELLGLAGFYHGGRHFGVPRLQTCVRDLGLIRGLLLYLNLRLFLRSDSSEDLVMDGIAVSAAWQGKGIGTRLLNAVFDAAREHGYRSVCLGVADTNPDARRLYERAGFVAYRVSRYPLADWLLGFSSVVYMRKPIT